jgi:serine-type D-Ala-D-Ala carboxypeptidase/endopeptidase (penicillin-binding protein 4)
VARRDREQRSRGGWRRRIALLVGLILVAAGGAAVVWRLEPGGPGLPELVAPGAPSTSSAESTVPSEPLGVQLATPDRPAAVARPVQAAEGGTPNPAAVRRAIAGGLADPALGPHVVARVADLGGGDPRVVSGRAPMIPASTMKLLTATAALALLGPDHVFTTRVVHGPGNQIVLVGGGDPTLASRPASGAEIYPRRPDVQELAASTAAALRRGSTVRLRYDATLFTGPSASPHWEPGYVPDDVVAPISALWVDEGRPAEGYGRVDDPPAAAAGAFARALKRRGIKVVGPIRPGRAPAADAELASVSSAPLEQIVERVLETSDNEGAEVLFRQVGLADSGSGSFAGGTAGVRSALGSLGVPMSKAQIYDGSGLSREDRLDPATLVAVLQTAADPAHPELRSVLTGLPVAGATGSLTSRFTTAGAVAGRGMVRAKTGTLTGVSSLAGLATGRDGTVMVFVLGADRFAVENTLTVRAALDDLASDLASCRCGTRPPAG